MFTFQGFVLVITWTFPLLHQIAWCLWWDGVADHTKFR